MSRHYWIAAVALGFAGFLVFQPAHSNARPHTEQIENGAEFGTESQQPSHADRDKEADEPQWWYWTHRLVAMEDSLAQWIMALFTIAAAAISYRAVVLVDRTLRANTEAVEVARRANEIAQETAQRQLRAYVEIGNMRVKNFRVGEAPLLSFESRNFGQTPAYRFTLFSNWRLVGDADKERILRAECRLDGSRADLASGATVTQFTELPMLEQAAYDAILNGKRKFVVFGVASYRDIFGTRRRVLFKHVLIPERLDGGSVSFELCRRNNLST